MSKKIPRVLFFTIPLTVLMLSGQALAQPVGINVCMDIEQIHVKPISFEKRNIADALDKIIEKTGYFLIDKAKLKNNSEMVSVKDLTGYLKPILDHFSKNHNLQYAIENCKVIIYNQGELPSYKNYELKEGALIKDELMQWALKEDWKLNWYPNVTWEVFSNTSIHAYNAQDAIYKVIEFLRLEGKKIQLRVYVGNKVMEVENLEIGEK